MKKSKLTIYIAMAIFALGISSCTKKEGCTDPNASNYDTEAEKDDGNCNYDTPEGEGNIKLKFHPMVGMDDLVYDQVYSDTSGRKFSISKAQFYVSGLILSNENGDNFEPEDGPYLLVHAGQLTYDIGSFNADHYDGLSFDIGIEESTNTGVDPATWSMDHPLSADNSNYAYWSWNSGYQFIKIEGKVDTTADKSGSPNFAFEMHIGAAPQLRSMDLSTHVDVENDGSHTIDLMVNYQQVFGGVDLKADHTTHTMDNMPLAVKIADNLSNAISVQ